MTYNRSLKGFTLLEMIIAICIGAIVLAGVFSILLSVRKQWAQHYNTQEAISDILYFKKTIEQDIEKADYIKTKNDKDYFFISEKDTVKYTFDTIVVRLQANRIDKFRMKLQRDNKTTFANIADTGKVVTGICIHIIEPIDFPRCVFSKYYASGELLKIVGR